MAARRVIAIPRAPSTWERRAPLVPDSVRALVSQGNRVIVNPSSSRAFTDAEYEVAGAEITESMDDANLVLTVGSPEPGTLLEGKTYATFSHLHKAQPHSMPLLDEARAKRVRLLDYELITEGGKRGGRRLVSFAEAGGRVGMVNIFAGIGSHLLSRGFATPFLNAPQAWMLDSLWEAREAVWKLGERIRRTGLPPPVGPLVFVFMGDGAVSRGARDIFSLLPHRFVEPAELPALHDGKLRGDDLTRTLYACVVRPEDVLQPLAGGQGSTLPPVSGTGRGSFDRAAYRAAPSTYSCSFGSAIAPYSSVLVNAVGWDARYPRWLTRAQHQQICSERAARDAAGCHTSRLMAVADISCDLHGAIEATCRLSTSSAPFYSVDALGAAGLTAGRYTDTDADAAATIAGAHNAIDGERTTIMAVPNLAAQLPREASEDFASQLLPFVPDMLDIATSDAAALPESLALAASCVTDANGALTPAFQYIEQARAPVSRATVAMQGGGACVRIALSGHLFDSGLINQVLDELETIGVGFEIEGGFSVNEQGTDTPTTSCVLALRAASLDTLDAAVNQLQQVTSAHDAVGAEGVITRICA